MDEQVARAAYDEQVRRNPVAGDPLATVERADDLVRFVSTTGWAGVTWSDLDERTADAAIAAQVALFTGTASGWEWKHYSGDQPVDLPERLVRSGFTRGEPETLLVAEIAELDLDAAAPAGVRLVQVTDRAGVEALVRVHEEVFGGDQGAMGAELLRDLSAPTPSVLPFVAMAGSTPIASARLELGLGTEFAGLFGGGTVRAWRHRGVFRALVAHRARLAVAAGMRYLHVDATEDSRPILRRLGFVELATTTPFTHPGSTG